MRTITDVRANHDNPDLMDVRFLDGRIATWQTYRIYDDALIQLIEAAKAIASNR